MRLQLRKRQAESGDIILLYGDESEALTHPYLARAWAKSGADLRVPAPGQAKKVAMLGSLDPVTRQLFVHTSPTKRSSDFVAHLEQLDHLYGPMPGRSARPVVLVEDNGPIHVSKLSRAALAARAHWLTVEWLPKYPPELNDIEVVWHDLKAHHLTHQTSSTAPPSTKPSMQPLQTLTVSAWSSRWPSHESLLRCGHRSGWVQVDTITARQQAVSRIGSALRRGEQPDDAQMDEDPLSWRPDRGRGRTGCYQ